MKSVWFNLLSLILLLMVNFTFQQKIIHDCMEGTRVRTVCTFNNVSLTLTNGSHLHGGDIFETRTNQYVKEVIFVNSSILEVPRSIFQKMPNMENLTMVSVGLKDELHKYSFEYANALVVLNLSRNNLTIVNKFTFSGTRKLEILDLSRNSITSVDTTAFSLCTKLKRLSLASNSLQHLPRDVFLSLENVFTINLSNNQLEEIEPGLFRGCRNLRDVKLFNNYLKQIHLELPYTMLKLDISNNDIEQVLLEPLHNRTTSDLRELLRVIAVNNTISSFSVHPDFVVSHVDLGWNALKDLTNISKITTMVDLSLAYNPIGKLPLNTFDNMPDLLFLNVEHTGMSHLEFGTFSQGAKLKHLDISYNDLEEIDLDMFAALSSLEELSLNGNNLTDLEYSGLLELFPRLRFIGISSNNWDCKTLANILKYLNKQHIRLLEDPYAQRQTGHNLKGIACRNTPHNFKSKNDVNEELNTEPSSLTLQQMSVKTIDKNEMEAIIKAELFATQDNARQNSSDDFKAIKIMVFLMLLINVVFFGIKLGRYIKTRKSSRSIRLSGGVKDENFMDDLVSA